MPGGGTPVSVKIQGDRQVVDRATSGDVKLFEFFMATLEVCERVSAGDTTASDAQF